VEDVTMTFEIGDTANLQSASQKTSIQSTEQRNRGLIWAIVAGLVGWMFIASVVAFMARAAWDDLAAGVQSTASTVSRVLAEYSDQMLISADLVRQQAGRIVGDAGPLVVDRSAYEELRKMIDISPDLVSVWIGDAEGQAVLTTREFPAPDLSGSARDYYLSIRDNPDHLYVGNLIDNRYPAEALLINTSRRLSDPNGDMRGFVQVSIDPAPIRELFRKVNIGFDSSLWWIGPEGRPLIREPFLPAAELDESAPPRFENFKEGSFDGSVSRPAFYGISGVDGEERLFFWSDAPIYGSRIIIGVSYDAMVKRLTIQMVPTVALGSAVGLSLTVILWLLYRARSKGLNYAAHLESKVRERTRELDRSVEQKDLILQELEHRVRNAFSTILALTRQMMRSSDTLEAFRREFPARLQALANTHLMLVGAQSRGVASIADLAQTALAPYDIKPTQIVITGPPVELSSERALGVGLILHELVTNSVKYGSLSADGGLVSVQWDIEAGDVHLLWREAGGPPVNGPEKQGSGTGIIDRAVAMFGGSIDRRFDPGGVEVDIIIPLR
jgi:two-component sensor histidine kinase